MFVFQDESVAPCISSPVQEVSSEQGFNLALLFFGHLDRETDLFSEAQSKELYMFNYSINGSGRYDYASIWDQAVCQVTNISQECQKTSNIQIEDLFSCLIEFTKLSNELDNFKSKLGPIIHLLEEMKTDPSKHLREIEVWDYVIRNSHKRLVFDYAEFSTEKEVSVEQGFYIAMLFFEDLYPLVAPHFSQDPKEQTILSLHGIVLTWGYEYPAEWNEAVFRLTKIPKWQQKEINIPVEILFPCVIEFTKIFHKRFEYRLDYLMGLLEAIQKDPDGFPIETRLWKQVIKDSYSARALHVDFDWNGELPDDEKY
ncbi:hypothetical protein [Candidatus Rhabdochlamydia sp. T3358]|uniref:hypothetical protein n=1 Tax=Candidatus Rhabdochlamydia sp. T3358 TaxID=2099795 RepID=UPI0010B69A85|nr:hypothetical protein [Candidatus Rhabdochlamydia sp. T3358]VHO04427.1 hypothetical protein RHT_01389 [Candidatus Rhabdochlamydia sp. T3358]